ncbi:hypothetical protein EX30DRAFT_187409 [Ascodesmis nigricans]|uniref:histidine kinase n=1 Tax=Ascodesmis nigricans TaxID=341454 RepID=A0A4S2N0M6_9PEZI|nr:hypothetical protein EX30DRAFT_187409 [Ascodesmis nigricans]
MKIKLKYQLCALVALIALASVGVLTLVTWFYTYDLVFDLRSTRLEVIASLKAKELGQSFLVYSITAKALAARRNIVKALSVPERSPFFSSNWTDTSETFSSMLTAYPEILYVSLQREDLQARRLNLTTITGFDFFEDSMGPNYDIIPDADKNTAAYSCRDGAPDEIKDLVPGELIGTEKEIKPVDVTDDGILLGPLQIGDTVFVASLTVPVYNNTTISGTSRNVLGYLTVVFNLNNAIEVANNTDGLGTGQVMIFGPDNRYNRLENITDGGFRFDANGQFKVFLPPVRTHEDALKTYRIAEYPVVGTAWKAVGAASGVNMDTRNHRNESVAVGYASVPFYATNSSLVLVVEQGRKEAFEPMYQLRRIVLGIVFGMFGVILLVTFPIAHFSTRQIGRLHEATKLKGRPPEYRPEPKKRRWPLKWPHFGRSRSGPEMHDGDNISDTSSVNSSGRRERFRIPQKVMIRKHWVEDELTALSYTFNAMTDELLAQYENLEAKVRQRTEELEQQKMLAESANEAKTMFIANVSHELRTPLNGILGMCALVLEENSLPARSRENLEVVFKSGELLSHLLNDLLTFSKNQVWGAQVKLEPSPFRIRDFISQIMALFGGQAKEKRIDLTYEILPSEAIEWVFTGDINRILQVVINLINNSLKFTPEEGSVQLMIVMEANPESSNVTPYTDVSDTPDYITSAAYKPSNSPMRTPSPTSTPQRPPLFTRRSASTGIVNPESDITKALPTRFRRFLNPHSPPGTTTGQSNPSASPSSTATAMTFNVEFRVIDTGPGIPDHMKQKIFEPFVQGDAGLSRKYGGTGLGLSICQQLGRLMGGEILLKTFEGAGSTFTLRIPLMTASPSVLSPDGSTEAQYDGTKSSMRRSVHTTSKSLSMLSSVRHAPSASTDGNVRLVGMSQPFFVPSRPDDDEGRDHDPPPPIDGRPYPQTSHTFSTENTENTQDTNDTMVTIRPTIQPPTPPVDSEKSELIEEKKDGENPKSDGTIRVLVAEDNKVNQQVLVKLLQLEKVTDITVAEDGVQAVDKVKDGMEKNIIYDVIFMDIQMPNMDGHESTQNIRALGHKAPIIALTAFADESNVKRCFESGMDCFLAKPIKRAQIKQMLKLYCGSKLPDDAKA